MIYWEKQKNIKSLYELYSRPLREKYGLTQMEYSILIFLHRNPGYDTAASIVQTSRFTKSHVSGAIRNLEEQGLLTKEYRDNNTKTIHLKLTEQADRILQESTVVTGKYYTCLFSGFSEEELGKMKNYFERICENAETALQNMEREQ